MTVSALVAHPVFPATTVPSFASLSRRFNQWRLMNQTFDELSALSDRQLYDLGVHRHEIAKIARESAGL